MKLDKQEEQRGQSSMIFLAMALVVLFVASFGAHAEDVDVCPSVGDAAEAVMEARQSGVDMSKMMAVARADKSIEAMLVAMVIAAYDQPRMSVPKNQTRSIEDFKNTALLACYKG